MAFDVIPGGLAQRLTHNSLRRYALQTGWVENPYKPNEVSVMSIAKRNTLNEFLLPLNKNLRDYTKRLIDAVELIAVIEQRLPQQVVADILIYKMDVFRIKLGGRSSSNGTISLNTAEKLYEGAKRLLLASAHTVLNPQIVHPPHTRVHAERFLQSCRCAQTEVGSYVAKFLCPMDIPKFSATINTVAVTEDLFPELLQEDEVIPVQQENDQLPFGRRVTSSLMFGAKLIAECAKENDPSLILSQSVEKPPVSANFCEALSLLEPVGEESYLTLDTTFLAYPSQPVTGVLWIVLLDHHNYFSEDQILYHCQSLRPLDET